MTTSPQIAPVQTLQPVSDERNLLAPIGEDAAGSCCGGGACGI